MDFATCGPKPVEFINVGTDKKVKANSKNKKKQSIMTTDYDTAKTIYAIM